MPKPSPAQLELLALVKFSALQSSDDPFDRDAIFILDTPPPSYKRVNVATVRALVRDGLIAKLPAHVNESGRGDIWVITPAGTGLLNQHKDHLPDAHREISRLNSVALLAEMSRVLRPARLDAAQQWANNLKWTEPGLREVGFRGFIPFAALTDARVPREAGVYVVLRKLGMRPRFREINPTPSRNGRPSTEELEVLQSKWVDEAEVLYIGKADTKDGATRGLKKRLDEFRLFGLGRLVTHWGGRYIWQLYDSAELRVAWKEVPISRAEDFESAMITAFEGHFGRRPFANIRGARGRN